MFYLCLSTHTGPTQAPNARSSAGARLIPQTGAERSEQHCCAHLIDNRYPEFQNHHPREAGQGSPSSTAKGKSGALCPSYPRETITAPLKLKGGTTQTTPSPPSIPTINFPSPSTTFPPVPALSFPQGKLRYPALGHGST